MNTINPLKKLVIANAKIALATFSALFALSTATPAIAFDQPWNGNREDITGPNPPPPPPCPSGNCQCPNGSNTSSPVYTADGSLVWSDTDIIFPVTTRVGLTRTYNSFDYRAGLFGRGWVTAQEVNIARTYRAVTEGNADGSPKTATEFESVPIWLASHGRRYVLQETATECSTPEVLYFTFQKQDDGTFRQVFEDSQSFSVYNENGVLLQEYSDKDGTTVYYEYDDQNRLIRQFDSYGFTLNFNYNERGFVSQLTDQADRSWSYSYDEFGRLIQVLDPDGNTKDYGYQSVDNVGYNQHLLTSVDDNIDDPALRVTWNSIAVGSGQGALMRVANYTESDGRRHDYTYSSTTFNGQAAIRVIKDTKQVGSNTTIERQTFIADAANYQILSVVNNTDNLAKNIIYNERGNVTEKTDERGNVTRYEYNLFGRKTRIVELADTDQAREIIISYWEDTDRISVINEYGIRETRFIYDSNARVLSQTEIDLSSNQQRVWSYTYHPNVADAQGNIILGKVASVDGSQSGSQDLTRFEYNAQGLLIRIDYPLNQSVLYSYNSVGQRVTETDLNGVVTEMVYDSRGRLVQTNRNSRTIVYRYNPQGLIDQLVDELGRVTEFFYNDQNQTTRIVYPAGEYLTMGYSYQQSYTEITESYYSSNDILLSRRIMREDPISGVLLSGYLDSISEQVYQDQYNEFDDITHSILYGQFGNTSGTTTSSYQYIYDRLGRTTQTVNGLNGTTEFAYDDMDRLIQVSDPNRSTTGYQYNAWGDLTRLDSPDTGVSTYEYNSAGSRTRKVDANNAQTSYTYDAQNRLAGIDYEGSSFDVSLSYDEGQYGNGKLTSVSDGSGSSSIDYNDRGLIVRNTSNIAGLSFSTNYQYNNFGQVERVVYPSGLTIQYNYDAFGKLSEVLNVTSSNSQNILGNVNWAGSKITSYEQGNGLITDLIYDLSERIIEKSSGSNEKFENNYDNQGNIVSQNLTLNGIVNASAFQYDLGGHLTRDGNLSGNNDWLFSYDFIGNRLSKQSSDNSQNDSYSYLQNSNRLTQINSVSIQYDAAGNILDDGARQFQYSAMNRLQQLTNPQVSIQAQYTYNYQGQRVRKQLTGSQTDDVRYVYGLDGELLGEYDSAGNRIREYIYYSNGSTIELIAQIETNGAVTYIHTDHLSVPRFATDQSQDLVWVWVSDAFGGGAPNEDADGDGNQVTINHRFAGQYYDSESGLHYNHFRYYDPQTGRYITSDPIALDGGLNTYAYVYQNPIRFSDPNGLAVPAVIGACAANPVCAAAAAAAARAAAAAAARAAARAAAAAAAAACAAGLGPCGSDPGDCSRSRHRYLQNIVDNLCKPNPGNCRAGESCSNMTDKLAKHTACANARRNINRECFRGGDRGHQIAYTTRRQQADMCNGLLATCCP